ncbi:LysR family transcriptional regulator [Streptomyces sp. WM6378]|uniref:LysR family transcriptional regulator n=1 Tax=Streptomyces sp. WM6378 TaxID=1415557 RepID=UPI001F408E5F|nr:LysR family transcriptional regulator [Streptomyces sp. WM6378]
MPDSGSNASWPHTPTQRSAKPPERSALRVRPGGGYGGGGARWASALTTQITRLENDLGQPLLKRAERGPATRLTPFGERVVEAAGEEFGGKGAATRGNGPTQPRD